jgi:hypothetical protein
MQAARLGPGPPQLALSGGLGQAEGPPRLVRECSPEFARGSPSQWCHGHWAVHTECQWDTLRHGAPLSDGSSEAAPSMGSATCTQASLRLLKGRRCSVKLEAAPAILTTSLSHVALTSSLEGSVTTPEIPETRTRNSQQGPLCRIFKLHERSRAFLAPRWRRLAISNDSPCGQIPLV